MKFICATIKSIKSWRLNSAEVLAAYKAAGAFLLGQFDGFLLFAADRDDDMKYTAVDSTKSPRYSGIKNGRGRDIKGIWQARVNFVFIICRKA
jgi:hypothetical protein